MNTQNKYELIVVDSLRSDSMCPACLQPIKEGENAYSCNKCGSLNHEICWQRAGCGSYHCQTNNSSTFTSSATDIVITKDDLLNLKEIPANSRYGTASIAKDIASKQKKTWSLLSIVALVFGLTMLLGSGYNFAVKGLSGSPTMIFLLSLGGCLVSIMVGAISIATFQSNTKKKGLLLSFTGMGSAILAMFLTLYPLVNSPHKLGDNFKLDMQQISETIKSASPIIKKSLMANVHIKTAFAYNQGAGSGVALCNRDAFTYILTNAHVLSLGKKVKNLEDLKSQLVNIEVTIHSGEKAFATPVWIAPDNIDMALVRIATPKGFVPNIKYEKGRPIMMGQRVFAIGNPIGLNWTYTDGVISALRKVKYGSKVLKIIQMQTPLNHGNSGGGLYDIDGYLVGINTWIYEKSATEGLNFAISFDELFRLLDPKWANILALSISNELAEREE